MKKNILGLLLLPVILTSCFAGNKGINKRYEVIFSNEEVDKDSLDSYFLNNEEFYPNYQTLKENQPDLLNRVKKIKEDFGTIEILKFSFIDNGFLDGMSFIHYENNYYPLGLSFGGYGLTEFVIRSGNLGAWLYFIYSSGSGIHRTHLGIFNIYYQQFYAVDNLKLETMKDYTLFVNKNDSIDLYEADIYQNNVDNDSFYTYSIFKKDLVYKNIDDMPKSII